MDVTDAAGNQYAHLHAQAFKFVKDKIDVTLASGEECGCSRADVMERNHTVNDSAGRHAIQISHKWIQIRDQYVIDIAQEAGPAAALPSSGPSTAGSSATDRARGAVPARTHLWPPAIGAHQPPRALTKSTVAREICWRASSWVMVGVPSPRCGP
jgi:hypothetical protein